MAWLLRLRRKPSEKPIWHPVLGSLATMRSAGRWEQVSVWNAFFGNVLGNGEPGRNGIAGQFGDKP